MANENTGNTKAKPLFPAHPTQVFKEWQQEAMEYGVFFCFTQNLYRYFSVRIVIAEIQIRFKMSSDRIKMLHNDNSQARKKKGWQKYHGIAKLFGYHSTHGIHWNII